MLRKCLHGKHVFAVEKIRLGSVHHVVELKLARSFEFEDDERQRKALSVLGNFNELDVFTVTSDILGEVDLEEKIIERVKAVVDELCYENRDKYSDKYKQFHRKKKFIY